MAVEQGADVNAVDHSGNTPILLAAKGECLPVCRLLLENGASPTAVDADGRSLLHIACVGTHDFVLDMSSLFIEWKVPVDGKDASGTWCTHVLLLVGCRFWPLF